MKSLSAVSTLSEFILFSRKNVETVAHFLPYFGPLPSGLNMHNPQYSFQTQNEPKVFNFKLFLKQQNPKSLSLL